MIENEAEDKIEDFVCGAVYVTGRSAREQRTMIGMVFGSSNMERACKASNASRKVEGGVVTRYNQKSYSSDLWGLWVLEKYRKNGIGKELFLWFCRCVKCHIYIR